MHPYIPHLLLDILNAHQPDQPMFFEKDDVKSFEEEMEEIEKWAEGREAEHTFGYYCGLDSINFPPPEQLTNEELLTVCEAFERMMFTWNVGIDLPDALPPNLRYQFTVNTLNEGTAIISDGCMTFDYCSGNAPDCVFKEYCNCLKYWNEIPGDDNFEKPKNDLDSNEDDFPF